MSHFVESIPTYPATRLIFFFFLMQYTGVFRFTGPSVRCPLTTDHNIFDFSSAGFAVKTSSPAPQISRRMTGQHMMLSSFHIRSLLTPICSTTWRTLWSSHLKPTQARYTWVKDIVNPCVCVCVCECLCVCVCVCVCARAHARTCMSVHACICGSIEMIFFLSCQLVCGQIEWAEVDHN